MCLTWWTATKSCLVPHSYGESVNLNFIALSTTSTPIPQTDREALPPQDWLPLEILVPARRLISPVVLPSRRRCDSSWKFLGTWGWSSIQRPEVLTVDKKRDGRPPKMQAFIFLVFGNAMLNKRNFHVLYVLSFGVPVACGMKFLWFLAVRN